jgi:predicted TIM-barrel fold metal-dependent hydrolase
MGMPSNIGIVDMMLGLPILNPEETYAFLKTNVHDRESKEEFKFPVEYMFKGVPHDWGKGRDPVEATLEEMDRWGIEKATMSVRGAEQKRALKEHPDRFIPTTSADPNRGMKAVYDLIRDYETWGVRECSTFPAGLVPQVDISDKKFFPLYAKCCELGIAYSVNVGVPGPRVPMHCQHVEHLDEVCWYFPELTLITYHGCEPWEELAVKLMLKWPGLHYATSAFAPKHYPKAIIDYANTRGADKIIYAGYFPMGLSLERIMTEMKDVPFRDHVWPKFLRDNALRVLKVEG